MKSVTVDQVMSWEPYSAHTQMHLQKLFDGRKRIGALDILKCSRIPVEDRLWIGLRNELLGQRILRLFACACVERTIERAFAHKKSLMRSQYGRLITVMKTAREYADGQATETELKDARDFVSGLSNRASSKKEAYLQYTAIGAVSGYVEREDAIRSSSYALWSAVLWARSVRQEKREWNREYRSQLQILIRLLEDQ